MGAGCPIWRLGVGIELGIALGTGSIPRVLALSKESLITSSGRAEFEEVERAADRALYGTKTEEGIWSVLSALFLQAVKTRVWGLLTELKHVALWFLNSWTVQVGPVLTGNAGVNSGDETGKNDKKKITFCEDENQIIIGKVGGFWTGNDKNDPKSHNFAQILLRLWVSLSSVATLDSSKWTLLTGDGLREGILETEDMLLFHKCRDATVMLRLVMTLAKPLRCSCVDAPIW